MSVGPMGMAGSVAGAVPQAKAAQTDRAQQDTADQARVSQSNLKAEQAAGIGQTAQDEQASDRDADGRRPWEIGPKDSSDDENTTATDEAGAASKDPSGDRGGQLDLSG